MSSRKKELTQRRKDAKEKSARRGHYLSDPFSLLDVADALQDERAACRCAHEKTPRGSRIENHAAFRVCDFVLALGWRDLRKPADGMRSGIVWSNVTTGS